MGAWAEPTLTFPKASVSEQPPAVAGGLGIAKRETGGNYLAAKTQECFSQKKIYSSLVIKGNAKYSVSHSVAR